MTDIVHNIKKKKSFLVKFHFFWGTEGGAGLSAEYANLNFKKLVEIEHFKTCCKIEIEGNGLNN